MYRTSFGSGAWVNLMNANSDVSSSWHMEGNSGTTPGTDFIGTADDQPLEFHVNGERALLLEPNGTSPNITLGHADNTISNAYYGSVIGGGGSSDSPQLVSGTCAVIAGGEGCVAAGDWITIGGGEFE